MPVQIPQEKQHNLGTFLQAWRVMSTARAMSDLYDANRDICGRYVHSTSRGHEAIQIAAGMQLTPDDYLYPYYRDDAMMLALGLEPSTLMAQLLGKDDIFSGGRSYYLHPSLRDPRFPVIPHQSSATGMQAIPATGAAHAIAYLESQKLRTTGSVVLCSLGDGAVTEGEVAEAFQMAVLKKLPIIYLVQDNDWGISATGNEMRAMNAFEYAAGFKGMRRLQTDGSDFHLSRETMQEAFAYVRTQRSPVLVHAKCPLLGHHTSGVRKEWYRGDDLIAHAVKDPLLRLEELILDADGSTEELTKIRDEVRQYVQAEFEKAQATSAPATATFAAHEFAPTNILNESGDRNPDEAEKILMVDAALHAVDELLRKHPEALFYGQDVGRRLGGVFREAATLAEKYGDDRVFNTPIQEAYIIGSTAGMSAVGAKAIVEIQFADYIWPGINQLVEELSKSCYLSNGKFPIQSLIRVPTGAYGSGGPYHSGSIESALLTIRGIKVVYPSNAAEMKGLMKAAFYDPNPVVMLEHKGLYWSKVPGTQDARTPEPDGDYIIPLGVGRTVLSASDENITTGNAVVIITYGMGVYWSKEAAGDFPDRVTIFDLRTLNPIDWSAITTLVQTHGRVLIITEEPLLNSFAESIAGRIAQECFEYLDAPISTIGAAPLPAVPLNAELEKMMLPNAHNLKQAISAVLRY